jgi:hypothetical protein
MVGDPATGNWSGFGDASEQRRFQSGPRRGRVTAAV